MQCPKTPSKETSVVFKCDHRKGETQVWDGLIKPEL
jgi:hypothetical protein